MLSAIVVLYVYLSSTLAQVEGETCDPCGKSSTYVEAWGTSGQVPVRQISASGCPNHFSFCTGKPRRGCPLGGASSFTEGTVQNYFFEVMKEPVIAQTVTDVACQGGAVGIARNGVTIYSGFVAPPCEQLDVDDPTAEWTSFDMCSGHAQGAGQYHYHFPPSCLVAQLGDDDTSHSPQIGWALDGFPVYGPRGPGGAILLRCDPPHITEPCLDECGGRMAEDPSVDTFKYRYYMSGEVSDLKSLPGSPKPSSQASPYSLACYKGCRITAFKRGECVGQESGLTTNSDALPLLTGVTDVFAQYGDSSNVCQAAGDDKCHVPTHNAQIWSCPAGDEDGFVPVGEGCTISCSTGYTLTGAQTTTCLTGGTWHTQDSVCQDIDECSIGSDSCMDTAVCSNTVGSYVCTCEEGLSGDGITECIRVNIERPNIIFFLADDLGYNDINVPPYNENPRTLITPALQKLAEEGVRLTSYYVQHICTPSRAAFVTGRYPIRTGAWSEPISAAIPDGIPLNEYMLPELLQDEHYHTAIIGKWHLGFYTPHHLPTARGFDYQEGFYLGQGGYNDNIASGAYDWHLNDNPRQEIEDERGDRITAAAINYIQNRASDETPFFLYVSYPHVHTPLEAPQRYLDQYSNSGLTGVDLTKAAMITAMDDSIHNIMGTLEGFPSMYSNTLVVFCSDNGAPRNTGGSNLPLRGWKTELWEGGTKAPAIVWHSKIPQSIQGTVNNQIMHITDWLPTFVLAAGGSSSRLAALSLDGVDVLPSLLRNAPSKRAELLYNYSPGTCDDQPNQPNAAIRKGDWKFLACYPSDATLTTTKWLFNLKDDPNEEEDVLAENVEIGAELEAALLEYEGDIHRPLTGCDGCAAGTPQGSGTPKQKYWAPWTEAVTVGEFGEWGMCVAHDAAGGLQERNFVCHRPDLQRVCDRNNVQSESQQCEVTCTCEPGEKLRCPYLEGFTGTLKAVCNDDCVSWDTKRCHTGECVCNLGEKISCSEVEGYVGSNKASCSRDCLSWDTEDCGEQGECICTPGEKIQCTALDGYVGKRKATCNSDCVSYNTKRCESGDCLCTPGEKIPCTAVAGFVGSKKAKCNSDCISYSTRLCTPGACVCTPGEKVKCQELGYDGWKKATCNDDCLTWDLKWCLDEVP